jgi:hypothetical protein
MCVRAVHNGSGRKMHYAIAPAKVSFSQAEEDKYTGNDCNEMDLDTDESKSQK